jgi:hypothetical protein
MPDENLIPASELCLRHNIGIEFIYSLQEYGLIEITSVEEAIFISGEQLDAVEKMIRLRYDLDVNMEGIDVILHLLKKLEAAEDDITRLKNQLRFYRF